MTQAIHQAKPCLREMRTRSDGFPSSHIIHYQCASTVAVASFREDFLANRRLLAIEIISIAMCCMINCSFPDHTDSRQEPHVPESLHIHPDDRIERVPTSSISALANSHSTGRPSMRRHRSQDGKYSLELTEKCTPPHRVPRSLVLTSRK